MKLSRAQLFFAFRPPPSVQVPRCSRLSPIHPWPYHPKEREALFTVQSSDLELCHRRSFASSRSRSTRSMSESQPSQTPTPQGHNRGGGRRRGRGGARQFDQSEKPDGGRAPRSRGSGTPRGGGGRGGRGGQNRGTSKPATDGDDGTQIASSAGKGKVPEKAVEDADDGEICFICASTVEHNSVSPCNHRTCHICALRLRALYKNKACAHCRVCTSKIG